ncbi:30S ribosome-binding factor RbfA [Proteocatella sphenisci]|uniref:30S ribosome-binding factor RbfA n=1 Tax=Proteocatella sphenisci TaxID=181070 RepID=UPI00048E0345|nr:30S ribosome-binding factor RbfA [Proteocatella sphenisci]
MSYARTSRISEEIKKIIGKMLFEGQIKDVKVSGSRSLISVTGVEVVRDLRYAYVYISVLGKDQGSVMQGLKRSAGFVRREVGKQIDIRYIPEIIFKVDDSIERGAHMSKIINDLNKESDDNRKNREKMENTKDNKENSDNSEE